MVTLLIDPETKLGEIGGMKEKKRERERERERERWIETEIGTSY